MAVTNSTTTAVSTTYTQTGSQLQVTSQSNTVTIGDLVTDVTLQPYIASRVVSFFAYNMRPNQRLHIFFDGVLVDDYCAPGIRNAGNNYNTSTITSTADYTVVERNGAWGTPIFSDFFGVVTGQFNIPAGTFKTGERALQICDVTSLAQGNDAITTSSSAFFVASNLTATKKTITLTTVNPELSYLPLSNSYIVNTSSTNITITPNILNLNITWHSEPLAQALTINTPNGQAGVYITSIDLYFKAKSALTERGVSLYICETDNGYPNGNAILPFGTVHLNNSEINADSTGVTPTKFIFEAPIFLNNAKIYAFIVKPDANDPDFQVFTANLGDNDIVTNFQVSAQPLVGTAFFGATTTQWTALQSEYVKFNLKRANFKNQVGNSYFNNSNTDYLTIFNLAYSNSSSGILPGDRVYQSTNSSPTTANTSIYGTLKAFDDVKDIFYVANSTGNFTGNSFVQVHRFANSSINAPNTTTIIAYANTGSLYDPAVNALVPQFATITPPGTSVSYQYYGIGNTGVVDTIGVGVAPGSEVEMYDRERLVKSKSNEGGTKSMTIKATLQTDNEFISPLIDTVKYQQLVIANDIDGVDFDYNEFFNTGASKSKYISKVVTLAEGQDAEDLQVIISAFKPPSSSIQIWAKFLNKEDSDPINNKVWIPLIDGNGSTYSDPSNPNDFREFVYSIPKAYGLIPTSGTITCNTTNTKVTGVATLFGTDVKEGWYINMVSNTTYNEVTRKVISITNSTSLTLDNPFNTNYTGVSYFVVPPPTSPYLSSNSYNRLTGNVTTYSTNNTIVGYSQAITANTTYVNNTSDALLFSNANTDFKVGDRIFYYVPTGNTPISGLTGNNWYFIATSNTTSVTLNSQPGNATPINITAPTTSPAETHGLNKTGFDIQLSPGDLVLIGGDTQSVVSIANGTSMTVGTPWTSDNSKVPFYKINPLGLTYLSNTGGTYTSFKQFQLKIILQSDDSSKVPLIDDLRVLALQL